MKTPMQELFYRIEQLRFAKNPIDELMMIKLQMLEKEKEVIQRAYKQGVIDEYGDTIDLDTITEAEEYYNKTLTPKIS